MMTRHSWLGGVVLGLALAAAVWLGARNVSEARAQAAIAPLAWDYLSTSVELVSLSNKLTELGNDGWEVISVFSTRTELDSQSDTKPHIVTLRVEVVARRPRAR
jgi:hypothetical protein